MTTKPEYKIIADHLRSSSFLIADGILPSNEGRGYVLRRILRRAMLQLFKLDVQKPTMHKFVNALIKEMGQAYPELIKAKDLIVETLKNEEEKFRSTLKNGLKIIEEEISAMKSSQNHIFDAKIAFKLHDTYGFPLDLTQIILDEKFGKEKITIDQKEFDAQMEIQKETARANWKGGGEESLDEDVLRLQSELGETIFTGYENFKDQAKILYISNNGSEVQKIAQDDELKNCYIILDQTPFYATSGGQRGDDGILETQNSNAKIKEAKKIGKLFIHQVKSIKGTLEKNQKITALINQENRKFRTYNHSATHLVNQALRVVLGNSITQKGSSVEKDYFTFDFSLNRAMTAQEITKVEELVNFYINQGSEAKTQIMDIKDAMESGAQALFGEKYDKKVRVVSLGKDENGAPYSIELCGGTHVKNTKDIGFFKIISEKSIASGVRRIEGRTNEGARQYLLEKLTKAISLSKEKIAQIGILQQEILAINSQEKFNQLESVALNNEISDISNLELQKINEGVKAFEEQNIKYDSEIKSLTKKLNQLRQNQLVEQLNDIKIEKIGEVSLLNHTFAEISAKDLTQIANRLKSEHKNSTITLLFATNNDKISALIQISEDLLAKYDASALIKTIVSDIGAKGAGGKKDFAMTGGDNPSGAKEAIETIKNQIK